MSVTRRSRTAPGRATGRAGGARLLLGFALLFAAPVAARAQPLDALYDLGPACWNFTFENDLFAGEDTGYTNGVGITYATRDFESFNSAGSVPGWMSALFGRTYIETAPERRRAAAHMFFQMMQTPEDITRPELQRDDLPYVGLLAYQGTMYSWNRRDADQLSAYLGWVGSGAVGEQAQSGVHRLIGADQPEGWDNQIGNEPVVRLELQRSRRLAFTEPDMGTEFDAIALGRVGVGNLLSSMEAGLIVRGVESRTQSSCRLDLSTATDQSPGAVAQQSLVRVRGHRAAGRRQRHLHRRQHVPRQSFRADRPLALARGARRQRKVSRGRTHVRVRAGQFADHRQRRSELVRHDQRHCAALTRSAETQRANVDRIRPTPTSVIRVCQFAVSSRVIDRKHHVQRTGNKPASPRPAPPRAGRARTTSTPAPRAARTRRVARQARPRRR